VPRGNVIVRQPEKADISVLLDMWEELRTDSGRTGPLAPAPTEARLLEFLENGACTPESRGVVAEVDGEVVGMACFVVHSVGPLIDTLVVQVDYLHVRPSQTRRGAGRALVAAAATYAEEVGAEHVSVNVFPHVREANRFYAKLGFSPLVVRRIASVSALRHTLAPEEVSVKRRAGVLARRRVAVRLRGSAPASIEAPATVQASVTASTQPRARAARA
jgi:GNAT superfamily N-acetyltransferase